MIITTIIPRRRIWLAFALLALAAGCVTKRIVWSPDGQYAAVIGENGLYLSDGDGNLSGVLATNIIRAEWFPDSRRLAVARGFICKTWAEVQPFLSREVRERIESAGQRAVKDLDAGHDLNSALVATALPDGREKNLLGVHLKSIDGVRKKAGQNAGFLDSFEAKRIDLCVATVADGKVTVSQPLMTGFQEITDLRVAPGGTMIAYTTEPDDPAVQHEYTLKLVPADASQPAQVVTHHASAFPDWTSDGRSLVFIKAMGAARGGDQLRLGSVARSRVVSDAGKIEIPENADELAGVLFEESGKVRCLGDGRIVFSAIEAHLPTTAADMPQRQQLFALDPEKQSTLTALIPRSVQNDIPENVSFFEVSPDLKRISIIGDKYMVAVLTLATGAVDAVQPPVEADIAGAEPVWRSSSELCFISIPKADNPLQAPQAAIWKNGKVRILSETWPDEVRHGLLDK